MSLFLFQNLFLEKEIGTLEYGATANFIFLDDDLNVKATFARGERAWDASWDTVQTQDVQV